MKLYPTSTTLSLILICTLNAQQKVEMKHDDEIKTTLTLKAEVAAINHDIQAMKEVLQSRLHIDSRQEGRAPRTMLQLALRTNQIHRKNKNQDQVVSMLLKAKADPNVKDSEGLTPLYEAITNGLAVCVDELIKAGADVNAQDSFENSVLENAINHPQTPTARLHRLPIMRALLNAGANPNSANKVGWTPFMYAASNGTKELILLLLNYGANPYTISHNEQIIREKVCNSVEYTENNIKQYCNTYAEKTFFKLPKFKPDLLEDPDIKAAIKDYDARFSEQKKNVAQEIEASIEPVHFPPVLANIVAEYAVECAPKKQEPKKQGFSRWCVIS